MQIPISVYSNVTNYSVCNDSRSWLQAVTAGEQGDSMSLLKKLAQNMAQNCQN
jgi:hypothetical protein